MLAGKVWFDRELVQNAVGSAALPNESEPTQFSHREREVLSFVFEGLANKEIADRTITGRARNANCMEPRRVRDLH